MNMKELPLSTQEKVMLSLRGLYSSYGYIQFKMNKFEEYDLYARNKDFLISDHVITFTDLNGKLMALKPDVTLSMVKNSKDLPDSLQKLYYVENVYRGDKGTGAFKEIMQVGLECLGCVDDYCLSEVLSLAAQSLLAMDRNCILDISHLGLLSDFVDAIGVTPDVKSTVFQHIGAKNRHELAAVCRGCGVSEDGIADLQKLIALSGTPDAVLTEISRVLGDRVDHSVIEHLQNIIRALPEGPGKEMLRFDFSVVDDFHYYNGLVFKGFVQGIPQSVLSGGQYDKLMRKMGRTSDAVGFAVYMDMLERLDTSKKAYDVDVILLYDAGDDLNNVRNRAEVMIQSGSSVMVQRTVPENIRYRKLMKMTGNEVTILGNDA